MTQKIERLFKADSSEPLSQESFEDQMKKSPLYASLHLIDDAFLKKKLKQRTKDFLLELSQSLVQSESYSNLNGLLIEQKILTVSDFQARAVSQPGSVDVPILAWALTPRERLRSTLSMLIEKKIMTQPTLWSKFLNHGNFFNRACYKEGFDWKHVAHSGILMVEKIDTLTDGFDAVEIKALKADLLGESTKSKVYPLDRNAHPLVQRMRGQENTGKMSQQIEAVLGPRGNGSVMEDFGKVFEFYLKKASFYGALLKRDKIPEKNRREERAQNIKSVNDHQLNKLKAANPGYRAHRSFDPTKRNFDIYARYGFDRYGSMDPLQLAFISRAAEWYIMGGRSRLFNSVRVVPYLWAGEETIPYVALAACRDAELLPVNGSDFTGSIVGANRTFLTHSDSMDATRYHSIPIIGLATYNNPEKRSGNKNDFVVFHANFDPKDQNRYYDRGKVSSSKDVNGDIVGLINETLRTMVEVEDREIARAEAAAEASEMSLAA